MPLSTTIEAIASGFTPGERVFLAGSGGEVTPLWQALVADLERTRGVLFTTSLVPGINTLDPARLHPDARHDCMFMQPGWREAQQAGRFRHLPVSYYGFVRLLRERLSFDTCVLQVSPPDAQGRCSLGTAVEFAVEAVARSTRVIGVVNPRMPHVPTAPTLDHASFAAVAHADWPLPTYDVGEPDPQSRAIAASIAAFIGDGAALQIGLGKVPSALLRAIDDRRRLRLQSGMLSDGVIGLADAGALDPAWRHATCVLVGTTELYEWAAGRRDIHVLGCGETHDPVHLTDVEGLVAVNSALEVDLLGQCNLEIAGGRAVSGSGGAPDFSYAASRAVGGISIVALPSTHGGGKRSRVLARLGDGAIATLSRTDVDVVVTEQGAADLRGLSVHARAEALIEVAAPQFRADLREAWKEIAARL